MQLNGLGFDWGSFVTGVTDIGSKVYTTTQQAKAQTAAIKAQTAADIAARQEAARMTAYRAAQQPAGFNLATITPLVLAAGAAFLFLKKRGR